MSTNGRSDGGAAPTVVVGVDGSAGGDLAVRWAADAAALRKVPLRVVHVVKPTSVAPPTLTASWLAYFDWEGWARDLVAQAAGLAQQAAPSLTIETNVVVDDAPAHVLAREAATAELLVIGANRHGRIAGALLGSTAISVIEVAPGPVVVIRASEHANDVWPEAAGQVVVGVDGSQPARQAVRFALAEAALWGVGLMAIHAWTKPPHPGLHTLEATGWLDWSFLKRHAADVLAESLAAARPDFPKVPVTERVVNEQPGAALVDASAGARLLVVGSRGRGGLTGLVLGSISHGVLHQAHCPVAVVRPRSPTEEKQE